MFLVLRLMWMSLLVYMAAAAMTVMLGVPEEAKKEWIPLIVVVTALVAVIIHLPRWTARRGHHGLAADASPFRRRPPRHRDGETERL